MSANINEHKVEAARRKLKSIWADDISGPWLPMGLEWSGDLTTLECAFLNPTKFFEALSFDEISDDSVGKQAVEIADRLQHIKVPRQLDDGRDYFDDAKFCFEFGADGELSDFSVSAVYGDASPQLFCTRHLDMRIAWCMDTSDEQSLFAKKVCNWFFGTERPSLGQLSAFIRDADNFEPVCGDGHWGGFMCERLCAVGYLERID